jgi:hypothetical protein
VVGQELALLLLDAQAGGDGEQADVVGRRRPWGDEVGQAAVRAAHAVDHRALGLQAQRVPACSTWRGLVGVDLDVSSTVLAGQQRDHAVGLQPAAVDRCAAAGACHR